MTLKIYLVKKSCLFTENDEGFDVNVKEDWELAKILINNGEASLPKINKKSYLE